MDKPALLVSYYYLKGFLDYQSEYSYRDWVLDSGAYSAHNSGVTIDLDQYIEKCLELKANDPTLTEIFSLDVIGDEKASLKNVEIMWKRGVEAIPTYHFGSSIDALLYLAKHYPKIALGGIAKTKGTVKAEFAKQCFARVWPKKVHGFGYGSETHIMAFPFHSCDATNWELGPCGFGRWQSFGKMSVRGSKQNLRSEVEWYLRLEEKAQSRWRKEMKLLDNAGGPQVRLVGAFGHSDNINKLLRAATVAPSVRLAVAIQRDTQHTLRLKHLLGKEQTNE